MSIKENSVMKTSLNENLLQPKKKDDNIHNFFRSSMNKLAKHDSDSGVHLVGPMFEMTAWMDSKIKNFDFELDYPSSSLSYGPTICSFGLEYNDHNYALPTGLTPPSMAPHLVDLNIPFKPRKSAAIHSEIPPEESQNLLTNTMPPSQHAEKENETKPPSIVPIKTEYITLDDSSSGETPKKNNPVVVISKKKITIVDKTNDIKVDKISANVNQFNEGMSESKKKLFSAWHAKAAESGHLLITQNWPYNADGSNKGKYKTKQEGVFEIRQGHEPKLLQIPDYLAVSPSALSDTDDELEVQAVEPFGASGIVNGIDLAPSDFPTWFLLRCACGVRNTRQRLVQCTRCKYWQHLDCMMAMYSEIEERNSAKMASLTANTGSSRRHNSRLVPDISKCSGKGALELAASNANKKEPIEENNEEVKRNLVTISPNTYICELCGERPVNIEIAEKIQSIHTETEEMHQKTLNALKEANASFMAGLSNSCLGIDKKISDNVSETSSLSKVKDLSDDKKSVSSEDNVDTGQILDRALKLGLIEDTTGDTKTSKNKNMLLDDINSLINQAATEAAASSADKAIANHKAKMALEALNASKEKAISEALDAGKKKLATTNINQRVPSPPRASKRKQDLSNKPENKKEKLAKENEAQEATLPQPKSNMPFSPAAMAAGVDPSTALAPFPLKRTLFHEQLANSRVPSNRIRGGYNTILKRYACAAAMLAESTAAMYNPLGNAWTKNYREADHNIYSKALMSHITSKLALNIDINYGVPPNSLTRNPLCRVVMFDHNDKGLEASISLSCNEVVIEARGRLMLLEEYEHHRDPYSDYNRYGFIYKKFSDRAIVIDASAFGNDARFIRRSCIPNCNLDHIIIRGKLHLVVRTLMDVTPGNELTLPFDIDYRALHYPIDCACGRSRCPVQKWSRKLLRNKVVPSMDYSKYIESQLKVLSTPLNPDINQTNSMYSQSSVTNSSASNIYENSVIGSPIDAYRSSPWSTPGNTPVKNTYPKSPVSLPQTPNKNVMLSPGSCSVTVKRKLASGCSIIKEVPVSPDGEIKIGESMGFETKESCPVPTPNPSRVTDIPSQIEESNKDDSLILISDDSGEQNPKRSRRNTTLSKEPTIEVPQSNVDSKRSRRKKQILDI